MEEELPLPEVFAGWDTEFEESDPALEDEPELGGGVYDGEVDEDEFGDEEELGDVEDDEDD